ncbi:hypothetical protein O3M35_004037 [Rhynocoris fuscipes]|uniref:Serine/threonine-protein kinase greatwall n=1 Tax=Rhynocoris fuscipes TaxID=488301 RepID=A0AAW1CPH5_9HEMI
MSSFQDHSIDGKRKPPGIDDFHVIKPISRGGFGKVFLGYKKPNIDQLYAIKVIKKSHIINKNMVNQMVRERNALAIARAPYCVNLYYSLQTPEAVFLVMEYLIGGDLKSLLHVYGCFDIKMTVFYASEIILALKYLHQHNIIHRDIKPDNMLLTATGHVRLTDFGLSRVSIHGDLELKDLMNCSPEVITKRTPGQLLSLTSHLTFGSSDHLNKSDLSSGDQSISQNVDINDISNVSGVVAFMSPARYRSDITGISNESFYTCSVCSGSSSHTCSCKENYSPLIRGDSKLVSFRGKRRRLRDDCRACDTPSGLFADLDVNSPCTFQKSQSENNATPLRGVLKKRYSSGENAHAAESTPVAGYRKFDTLPKVKRTRFLLPNAAEDASTSKIGELTLSPIISPKNRIVMETDGVFKTPTSIKNLTIFHSTDDRIFGTPDYLAPELFLKKKHGQKVDWWSLGICMYEFCTGALPFADETPEAVFNNVLSRELEWPEGDEALPQELIDVIDKLLQLDPDARADGNIVSQMPLFNDIDWENLHSSSAPFIPQPDNNMDTSYFSARNALQNIRVSEFDV